LSKDVTKNPVPVLVTGAGGLLGGQVAWTFAQRGVDVYAFTHAQLDITDADAVREQVEAVKPGVVIHPAALTNVDACERDPERAYLVNATGSRNVAAAAAAVDAAVVAVSTDYVFDGEHAPYAENAPTDPIQEYGRSKLAGEVAVREVNPRHFIVRSAWIYGPGGKNFLSKLPELAAHAAEDGQAINAVVDQYGSPTYAPDLAEAIFDLVLTQAYGTLHVVNTGRCSFAEFCETALKLLLADVQVNHVRLGELDRPAPRPRDTYMVSPAWEAAGFAPLRPWQEAAADFVGSL
jgi:dTDP-4-dehydrorhamnose reductase